MHGTAEEVVGAHRVGDPVGTHLLRVVVEDRHAAPHSGLEHHRGHVEPAGHHLAQVGRDQRHRRGHRDAASPPCSTSSPSRSSSWVSSKRVLVGGALGHRREAPVMGEAGRLVAVPRDRSLGRVVVEDRRRTARRRSRCCRRRWRAALSRSLLVAGRRRDRLAGPCPPPVARSRSRPRSRTGAEWVSAPTEIRSAPAAAIAGAAPRSTPPDTSTRIPDRRRAPERAHVGHARPPTCCRA